MEGSHKPQFSGTRIGDSPNLLKRTFPFLRLTKSKTPDKSETTLISGDGYVIFSSVTVIYLLSHQHNVILE